MAEQETHDQAAEDQTVTTVTDSELDAALDGVLESEKTETQEATEQVKEEVKEPTQEEIRKQEHAERSQLGRKVAAIEKQFQSSLAEIMDKLDRIGKPVKEESVPELAPDDILTVADLDKLLEQRNAKAQKQELEYSSAYVKTLYELCKAEDDDELMAAVIEEHDSNTKQYVRKTGNPVVDAELNYNKAVKNVLRKSTTAENPLKGEKPKLPIGVSGKSHTKETPVKMPKLEGMAAEFVAQMGKDEKWASEALKD